MTAGLLRGLQMLVLILLTYFVRLPVHAEAGKQTVESLVDIFVRWTGSQSDKTSYAKAAEYIDYTNMSSRVLGQTRWQSLSNQQRNEFVSSFRKLIEQRYYPRWRKIFSKAKFSYVDESPANDDTLVKTQVKSADSVKPMTWTVNKSGKVVSLRVGEKDLVIRASQRFKTKLSKCTFDQFLAWIKKEGNRASGGASEDSPT